jgi:hypothetical protein
VAPKLTEVAPAEEGGTAGIAEIRHALARSSGRDKCAHAAIAEPIIGGGAIVEVGAENRVESVRVFEPVRADALETVEGIGAISGRARAGHAISGKDKDLANFIAVAVDLVPIRARRSDLRQANDREVDRLGPPVGMNSDGAGCNIAEHDRLESTRIDRVGHVELHRDGADACVDDAVPIFVDAMGRRQDVATGVEQ